MNFAKCRTEVITVGGVKLLAPVGTATAMLDTQAWQQHVNGCGAGNAKYDLIPDKMYGLPVTPV